jgi:hypothetical protein
LGQGALPLASSGETPPRQTGEAAIIHFAQLHFVQVQGLQRHPPLVQVQSAALVNIFSISILLFPDGRRPYDLRTAVRGQEEYFRSAAAP